MLPTTSPRDRYKTFQHAKAVFRPTDSQIHVIIARPPASIELMLYGTRISA